LSCESQGADAAWRVGESEFLPPNLPADSVLLLIERLLLCLCDVAAVEFRHRALLLPDRAIFAMKLVRLLLRDLTFLQLTIDPVVLVSKSVVT